MKSKGNRAGIIYFFVHFLVEVISFAALRRYYPLEVVGLAAFTFDAFAFVPQGLLGELISSKRRVPFGTIGVLLMGISLLLIGSSAKGIHLLGIAALAVGNAILHAVGALCTVTFSEKKIFPAALFVAGGSFGVITGQTMGIAGVNLFFLLIPLALIEVLVVITRDWKEVKVFPVFNCVNKNMSGFSILLIAFLVTAVRSFLGYAIPISWRKEVWQGFLLFFVMGIGKAAGGYLVDKFGARRVGVSTTLLAIPFLIAGANNMVISCIGVCLFSMTMCITFEMALSVLPKNPGLAFGVTTIGLFAGFAPIFFYRPGNLANIILVVVFSIFSSILLGISCERK